jgi:hypothetical protein
LYHKTIKKIEIMKAIIFTNGKKQVKTYKEISNKNQGCYSKDEMIRKVLTDKIDELKNEQYDTRFEEVEN